METVGFLTLLQRLANYKCDRSCGKNWLQVIFLHLFICSLKGREFQAEEFGITQPII
jgi:hypothetical protein